MAHASTRPTTKCKNVSNVGRVRLNKIANDAGSNSNEAPVLEFLTGAGALGWPKGPCQADVTVPGGTLKIGKPRSFRFTYNGNSYRSGRLH